MKHLFIALLLAATAAPLHAANWDTFPAATTLGGTETIPLNQTGTTRFATIAQIRAGLVHTGSSYSDPSWLSSLSFSKLTDVPDPTITATGDVTGAVTLTDLASGTMVLTFSNTQAGNHTWSGTNNVTGIFLISGTALGSAAFSSASSFATSAQGILADASLPRLNGSGTNITLSGTTTIFGITTLDSGLILTDGVGNITADGITTIGAVNGNSGVFALGGVGSGGSSMDTNVTTDGSVVAADDVVAFGGFGSGGTTIGADIETDGNLTVAGTTNISGLIVAPVNNEINLVTSGAGIVKVNGNSITLGGDLTTSSFFTASGDVSIGGDFTTSGNVLVSGSSSGLNTGDQTITLTGDVTGSGTGSFATTVVSSSTTTAGKIQIATNAQVLTGTASDLAVVPSSLAAWANARVPIVVQMNNIPASTALADAAWGWDSRVAGGIATWIANDVQTVEVLIQTAFTGTPAGITTSNFSVRLVCSEGSSATATNQNATLTTYWTLTTQSVTKIGSLQVYQIRATGTGGIPAAWTTASMSGRFPFAVIQIQNSSGGSLTTATGGGYVTPIFTR